ncbi:MAG: calcium/proton exchanger [Candidatus Eisenbacteria bacterium]|uniref:Ca(2+)/H(+) antiporter n=1 Tax=Eiseniibacteriota bacterium TaxID=2212470 RepID=A0A849T0L7_UNCEI|nr:calcium/proton exchanger [Candidatus Eisenbacteria bacterium]
MTRATAAPRPRGLAALFAPNRLLQWLLVFVPLAVLAEWLHWGPIMVFSFACVAIIPLAGLMGEATEQLSARLGAGIGGLLNATFGNAAELIIALVALHRGLYDVVKASLTGSIIGNILLVLGASLIAGGLKRERQHFDRSAAAAGSTLLALAAIGLVVPAVFHFAAETAVAERRLTTLKEVAIERSLSLEISIVLFIVYVLSLVFSLRTHKHLYAGQPHAEAHEEPAPGSKPTRAVVTLLLATAVIAWMSELLVGAVEAAAHVMGLTEVFVGVIVVAIIGNAAEHSTAILVAAKNKMDLALNIAIGSSIQIALFVAPLLVFVSYFMPHGPMDLRFTLFEVLAVAVAVAVVNMVAQDGESNWLEGALMLAVYAVLAIAFFFLP